MRCSSRLRGPDRIGSLLQRIAITLIAIVIAAAPAPAEEFDRATSDPNFSLEKLNQFGFDSTVPEEVSKAAEEGLDPFLDAIPLDQMERYGFMQGSGFADVSLGNPYRVMTVDPQVIMNFDINDDIRAKLLPTQLWVFPILQNGEPRAILTVGILENIWQAVAIGHAEFARDLIGLERTWSDEKDYTMTLVRIYQATSDILLLTNNDRIDVLPMESARVCMNLGSVDGGAPELYSASDIIEKLAPLVAKNIEMSQD